MKKLKPLKISPENLSPEKLAPKKLSPEKLSPKKRNFIKEIINLGVVFGDKYVGNFASSTAFFFFISMIPICILVLVILPYLGFSSEEFAQLVMQIFPDNLDAVILDMIEGASQSASQLVPLSIIAIVWAAAKGMTALIRGFNMIYGITERRNFVYLSVLAVFYTILMLASILGVLLLTVFGETIASFLSDFIGDFPFAGFIMSNLKYLIIMALAIVFFMVLYSFVPAVHQPFLVQFPGAVFSSAGWVVYSVVFSVFLGRDSSIYSQYYGAFAAVVLLMLWLYGTFYILLIGAYINAAFEKLLPLLKDSAFGRKYLKLFSIKQE